MKVRRVTTGSPRRRCRGDHLRRRPPPRPHGLLDELVLALGEVVVDGAARRAAVGEHLAEARAGEAALSQQRSGALDHPLTSLPYDDDHSHALTMTLDIVRSCAMADLRHTFVMVNKRALDRGRAGTAASILDQEVVHGDFSPLDAHAHCLLVTYKRDGSPIAAPVWFARDADGRAPLHLDRAGGLQGQAAAARPAGAAARRARRAASRSARRSRHAAACSTAEAERAHAAQTIRGAWGPFGGCSSAPHGR